MDPATAERAFHQAVAAHLSPIAAHPDSANIGLEATRGNERYVPAAVLVPVIADAASIRVLFTVRTAHLKTHAGQISFPGGRVEPDDCDVAATAIRETAEELGIPTGTIQVLGSLAPRVTGTGYRVVPVVGLLGSGLSYAPDEYEVAEVFDVPLGHLLAPGNRRRESRVLNGRTVSCHVIDYGERTIWGATAGIVVSLNDALSRSARRELLTPFLDAA